MWIQIILLVALAVIAVLAIRSPGGARPLAIRRIAVLVFMLVAIATVLFPDAWTAVAQTIGIGRGTDLLLYLLVIVVLGYMASSFQVRRSQERAMTQLARRIALDAAERPWLDEVSSADSHENGSSDFSGPEEP